jgi:molybdopterin-guanine dinucleotide biosynthesis protein A
MGRDKALLELGGKPLIAHAVTKLRRLCTDVQILGANPALAVYAPLVRDLHPGCGPIGGIEAAFAHSSFDWNLILAVDVPFLPTVFLDAWVQCILAEERSGVRIALFSVDGAVQPTVLLIHRDAAASIAGAIERGDFKLISVLEAAGRELATMGGRGAEDVLWNSALEAPPLWFANLNTPEDFKQAEANIAAFDS